MRFDKQQRGVLYYKAIESLPGENACILDLAVFDADFAER